ncbi:hypothetical protein AGMMS50222_04150 [Endomicrobiia bacterium]|nr:hypothetical protein AGMMS50222_04150 [Endomicrobiia bacterium]
MKNKKNNFNFTADDIKPIHKDFSDFYADHLKNKPSEIKHYKEQLVRDFNKTKDAQVFLEGLKTIAIAEGKIKELAKNAKVERTSVLRTLSKNHSPSFENAMSFASDLGICLAIAKIT